MCKFSCFGSLLTSLNRSLDEALFRQAGSLFRQSLRSRVSGKVLFSSVLFSSAKIKIAVSLCAAGTRLMTDTYSNVQLRYLILISALSSCRQAELQRLARAGGTSVTGTDQCRANTSLNLCMEADCTLCVVNCTPCSANSDLYKSTSTVH